MGKFNSVVRKQNALSPIQQMFGKDTVIVENYEGAIAFEMEMYEKFASMVLTSLFGEDKFYISGNDHDDQIYQEFNKIANVDPEFILQIALFARKVMNLRTIPIVLLAEASYNENTKKYVTKYAPQIISRADEIIEVVSYIKSHKFGGKSSKIPKCLKRGIEKSFAKFDEYQLSKYEEKKGIKFKDIIRMIHPKAPNKNMEHVYGILVGKKEPQKDITPIMYALQELKNYKEWNQETEKLAREAHATQELIIKKYGHSKETWKTIIPTLGYMALLRNIKHIIQYCDYETVKSVADKLSDPEQVKNSKQLPFRFYSAWNSLEENISNKDTDYFNYVQKFKYMKESVEKALNVSVCNLPKFSGRTVIAVDVSGSMSSSISKHSQIKAIDIASLLGSIAYNLSNENQSIVMPFGENTAIYLMNKENILENMEIIKESNKRLGHSTNAYKVIEMMIDKNIIAERIIILSDMQCWDSFYSFGGSLPVQVKEYWKQVNPEMKVYSVDLMGYGTAQIQKDKRVSLIAGWSEKVFDYIKYAENGNKFVDMIKKYSSENI